MTRLAQFCAMFFPLVALGGCAGGGAVTDSVPHAVQAPLSHAIQPEKTRMLDPRGADRLLQNKGLTLQWISWDARGNLSSSLEDGVLRLNGFQKDAHGPGRLEIDGTVAEVGDGYFTFSGKIRIIDAPDKGRVCEADKLWHFAITQNRPYYRLREFEWCDGLTDYVDIYF